MRRTTYIVNAEKLLELGKKKLESIIKETKDSDYSKKIIDSKNECIKTIEDVNRRLENKKS